MYRIVSKSTSGRSSQAAQRERDADEGICRRYACATHLLDFQDHSIDFFFFEAFFVYSPHFAGFAAGSPPQELGRDWPEGPSTRRTNPPKAPTPAGKPLPHPGQTRRSSR